MKVSKLIVLGFALFAMNNVNSQEVVQIKNTGYGDVNVRILDKGEGDFSVKFKEVGNADVSIAFTVEKATADFVLTPAKNYDRSVCIKEAGYGDYWGIDLCIEKKCRTECLLE